ncbi:MAG: AMP-binding protein [Acidobacteriota bacterium]|nr:AMP-binding protein [Acidobacteriota bacterium]
MYESPLRSIADYWGNSVRKFPSAPAAIFGGSALSYAEMDDRIARAAGFMRDELGVARGDRVAIALPNCLECLIAYWAALRLGAIAAPVNIRLRDEEIAFVIHNVAPRVVIVHEDTPAPVLKAVEACEDVQATVGVGDCTCDVPFSDMVARGLPYTTSTDIDPSDTAVVLHTSGTTGEPKGAIMTHETLHFNVKNAIFAHSFRHEDIHLLVIPFFAPTASYSLLASAAYLGSAICIAPRPDIGDIVQLIETHRCTTFIGVPTLFHLFINDPRAAEANLDSLRLIAYSGSPMPVRTIGQLRDRFPGIALHNFFGLTETISITHVLPSINAADRPDSIGKPLPEIDTRIIDDAGNDVPRGEIGELCFRRGNIIPGYWNRPGLLEESVVDGWFRTGDFARVDDDGFFYVHGRKKDMIIVAGQNVYALEVEKIIYTHPGVRDAAVIGIPATGVRAALGELVKAVVVPQPGERLSELDIKRHCSQHLASYKVPQVVEFRDELPRNAAGKVLKRDL